MDATLKVSVALRFSSLLLLAKMPRHKGGAPPRRLTENERRNHEWRMGQQGENDEDQEDDDVRGGPDLPEVPDWRTAVLNAADEGSDEEDDEDFVVNLEDESQAEDHHSSGNQQHDGN